MKDPYFVFKILDKNGITTRKYGIILEMWKWGFNLYIGNLDKPWTIWWHLGDYNK